MRRSNRNSHVRKRILRRHNPPRRNSDVVPRAAPGVRSTMNFWLPYRNLRSASRRVKRESVFPTSPTIVYTTSPIWNDDGRVPSRGWRERQKRRALEREISGGGSGDGVVAGGCRQRGWEGRNGVVWWSGGWRQIESRARRDRPREHRARLYGENHDAAATHNTYYPRFVEVVALGNGVFLKRLRCHRHRVDDEILDIEGFDYFHFPHTTRCSRCSHSPTVRLISRYSTGTIPVSFTGAYTIALKRLPLNYVASSKYSTIVHRFQMIRKH